MTTSTAWAKHALSGFAALLLIWSVVHLALSYQGLINPWKLGGWGMYSVPPPRYTFLLADRDGQNIMPSPQALQTFSKETIAGCISKPRQVYLDIARQLPTYDGYVLTLNLIYASHIDQAAELQYTNCGHAQMTFTDQSIVIEETFCSRTRTLTLPNPDARANR